MNSKNMKEKIKQVQTQETAQDMKDRFFKWTKSLSLELTRRCNMKCEFCCRGNAQNLNMSKQVIDKTLTEIQELDIHNLRLNGGEPFLVKDEILYLVDEIIRRNIKICDVAIFTNGTITDIDIKNALIRLGHHCKKVSQTPWGQRMNEIAKENGLKSMYNLNSYIGIIVSTNLHDNSDIIDDTINFYNNDVDPEILHTVNQDTDFIGYDDDTPQQESPLDFTIILRGNAEKNFQKLYDKGYRKFALHERNDFTLINDVGMYNNYVIIHKSISVSANGIVFPGCLEPYEELDKGIDNICNILDCNNDLYSHILNYCWKSPLTEAQAKKMENWQTILMYYSKGITDCWLATVPLTENHIKTVLVNMNFMQELETGLRKFHEMFPQMTIWELNTLGSVKYGYGIKDMGLREYVLTEICGLKAGEGEDSGVLPDFSDKTLEKTLDDYEEMYYNRQLAIDGEISFSDALVKQATKDLIKKTLSHPATITAGVLLACLAGAMLKNKEQDDE